MVIVKKWITWVIGAVWVIAFIISGMYAFSYIYNENIVEKYNSGDYDVNTNPLLACNFFEPHIAFYNNGNVYYQQGQYGAAQAEYEKALLEELSEEEECSVRINLALSMVYGLGTDYAAPENVEASLVTLKEARQVLLEKGCASDEGEGHNETAQKLKEEIDKMIEELENQNQQPNQNPDNQTGTPPESPQTTGEDEREEEIIEQLEQSQIDAMNEREDNMELYEDFDINSDYDYGGTIW